MCMTSQALPPVAGIAQRLSDSDYDHKLGLAVLARAEQKSWALAVLVVQTGEVLASDGWFIEEEPFPPEFTKSVVDGYDWEDWDDMPSKRIMRANGYWLSVMADILQPEYSLDECAATAVESHFDDEPQPLGDSIPVAYYPLRLGNVVTSLEEKRSRGLALLSFSTRPDPLVAVLDKLRAL